MTLAAIIWYCGGCAKVIEISKTSLCSCGMPLVVFDTRRESEPAAARWRKVVTSAPKLWGRGPRAN